MSKKKTLAELLEEQKRIAQEIEEVKNEEKQTAIKEIMEVAAGHGFTLVDLLADLVPMRQKRTAAKKEKVIKYRHPEQPDLTWGGGRGKKPAWINEWIASGHGIEECKVTE